MAIVPQARRENVASAGRPVAVQEAQNTGLTDIAAGLGDVADSAFVWQDEMDTADAKRADAAFTEGLNDLLYNEETGYMYSQGGDAMGRRASVDEQVAALYDTALDGLTGGARKKAWTSMEARKASARKTLNSHAATERKGYLNEASEARITASMNAAIFSPDALDRELQTAFVELDSMAVREGWASEVLAQKKQETTDEVLYRATMRAANVDPERALEMARANASRMSGGALAKLETTLVPMAKEHQGRSMGRSAASGGVLDFISQMEGTSGPDGYNTTLDYGRYTGGAVNLTGMTINDVMALQGDMLSHPDNPHNSSAVGRYQIVRKTLRSLVKEMGLTGNELFDENMQDKLGLALVNRRDGQGVDGMRNEWEGLNKASDAEILAAMSADPAGRSSLASISDPVVREAAMNEYDLVVSAAVGDKKAREAALTESVLRAMSDGTRVTEVPGFLDLPPNVRKSAQAYEAIVAAGNEPVTKDEAYVALNLMAADNPQTFMDQNLLGWRDVLDNGDFQGFVTMQRQMKMSGAKSVSAPAGSALMSAADAALRSAQITKTKTPARYEAFQGDMIRWAAANPEKANDPVARDEYIKTQLVDVVLNLSGWGGKQKGRLYEIDWDGEDHIQGDEITAGDILSAPKIVINGVRVPDDVVDKTAEQWRIMMGFDPSPEELFEALARYYK